MISSYREVPAGDPVEEGAGPMRPRLLEVQDRTLDTGRHLDWSGYSKHDALNAPWLETLAGSSRLRRIALIQLVMRSPLHVRPWLGVRRARNAKGVALFARALLARHRLLENPRSAEEGAALLDWLLESASSDFDGLSWGYPYPWQDVGFFAPRGFPNRVVTSFVVQALLDGYETLDRPRFLDAAREGVRFLLNAPRTLYQDSDHRCLSYVPSSDVNWIVMDVSALVGAAVSRYAAIGADPPLMSEAGRLIRYVASKQTDQGAWYYADPPSASHIGHDNYHTGFILDSILRYQQASGSDEFSTVYERGIEFYRRRLFTPDGAPRFMSDRRYPFDIHGAAQGVISFSLAQKALGHGGVTAARILTWMLEHLWDPETGWFYYQKRRLYRTRVRLLRWCQAWPAHALGVYLESVEEGG